MTYPFSNVIDPNATRVTPDAWDDLRRRREVLRLPRAELARLAGEGITAASLTEWEIGRTRSLLSQYEAARAVIEAEEHRLLAHLAALHPDRGDS